MMGWLWFWAWAVTFAALMTNDHKMREAQLKSIGELSAEWRAAWDHIEKRMGANTEARVLNEAADAWDSIEEKPNLTALARDKYHPGGPSMPAIWLRDRAAKKTEKESSDD